MIKMSATRGSPLLSWKTEDWITIVGALMYKLGCQSLPITTQDVADLEDSARPSVVIELTPDTFFVRLVSLDEANKVHSDIDQHNITH